QQHLAGIFRGARRQLEVAAELAFQDAVEALELLFLAQARPVFAGLAAALTVHAGSKVAAVDGALGTVAAAALQVELDAFATAQFADGIDVACHILSVVRGPLSVVPMPQPVVDRPAPPTCAGNGRRTRDHGLNAALLRRPAAVVRQRRDILDG